MASTKIDRKARRLKVRAKVRHQKIKVGRMTSFKKIVQGQPVEKQATEAPKAVKEEVKKVAKVEEKAEAVVEKSEENSKEEPKKEVTEEKAEEQPES
ncbi:MAG: hypothetical protein COA57_14020 [Flavobacteriales bacterium]|nr:MAG: hypothetical protein COA57_14020 [Flavobacteriales bacterium]